MKKIFLSHNHQDKEFVRRLGIDLQRLGAAVWLDDAEIGLGDSILARVQNALVSADYVAVILSPNSVKSHWVQRELEVALNEELNTAKVKVLPLLLADCDIPPFLQGRLCADFRSEQLYNSGVGAIAKRLGLQPPSALPALPRILSQHKSAACIGRLASERDIETLAVTGARMSRFSTPAFKARLRDGKGVIYCHAGGARSGQAFYVRKGIGWYYEYVLGGSESPLGLPTSNEEWSDVKGCPMSIFEGGYIQWVPATSKATAIETFGDVGRVIGVRRL